jgi:serine/threonine protein phosphatase PrpC
MYTIDFAGISEQGNVRFKNEDSIAHNDPPELEIRERRGSLFIVADGVGGHGAGDVASQAAVKVVTDQYYGSSGKPDRALNGAIQRANLHVFDLGIETNKARMQTTLSAIAFVGANAYIAHVGDSRIYRVRSENSIEQLTRDDSEVAELVRMKIVAPENARNHPRRSIITRSVGSETVVRSQIRVEPLEVSDTFVLCTDGIWEPILDEEIAKVVRDNDPEHACRILIDMALERKSKDNVSVQVISVTHISEELRKAQDTRLPWWKAIFASNGARSGAGSE